MKINAERYKLYEIVKLKLLKRHIVYGHYFCAYCGKELTKLDLKTGHIWQEQHFVGYTEDGLALRFCWKISICERRRKMRKKAHS